MLCLYFLRPLADSTEMKLVFDEAMAEIEGKRLNEEITFLSVFILTVELSFYRTVE